MSYKTQSRNNSYEYVNREYGESILYSDGEVTIHMSM